MKKVVAIALLVSAFMSAFAAKKMDECLYKFTYQASIRTTEEIKVPDAETYVLEVGKKVTKFYPPRFEQSTVLKDSVLSVGMSADDLLNILMSRNLFDVRQSTRVIYNYPSVGKVTEVGNMGDDYAYTENSEKQNWQIVSGDTIIAGHKCSRATTTFRGRNWTAWYAIDLPIHSGPWKLNGLPGLILYAADDKGYFVFDCKQMQRGESADMEYVVKSSNRKCSSSEFFKLKKQWLSNSFGLMLSASGISPDQTAYKMKSRTPILLEVDTN